jgi:hypothetical protein
VFLSCQVLSLVYAPIGPTFLTLPVLQVVHPVSFISRAIYMCVDAIPIGLIVDPIAFVHISVNVSEFALAMCPVILPVAFVEGSVGPGLLSMAVSESALPLTLVQGTTALESEGRSLFSLCQWIVLSIAERLTLLSHREITTVGAFGLSYQFCLLAAEIAAPKCLKLDDQVRLVLESVHEVLRLMGLSLHLSIR